MHSIYTVFLRISITIQKRHCNNCIIHSTDALFLLRYDNNRVVAGLLDSLLIRSAEKLFLSSADSKANVIIYNHSKTSKAVYSCKTINTKLCKGRTNTAYKVQNTYGCAFNVPNIKHFIPPKFSCITIFVFVTDVHFIN